MLRLLAALLLLALPATAQDARPARAAASTLPAAPLAPAAALAGLPEQLAGWQRGTVTDFEARSGGAGLGAGVEYRPGPAQPGVATIYLYDRGRHGLLPDPAGPDIGAEMATALQEVDSLAGIRRYQVAERHPIPAPAGLRCETQTLVFEGGIRAESPVCLGVVRDRFLKLRLTLPASQPGAAEALAGQFADAALAGLGGW
ncbi:hypothetical protein JYK14_21080 [Siccirubricoccus sp. KC 17139]|uniref:Uncharacterized protein n=1 Tax=Siccirubricoccus soli TaxID=2899147 RepID=A0ABT1D9M1_9PROT|nr:hypothetical protein [Siccirubricoccus soli]MCO6418629.1 hypothetical protein [Siccirubricoccus soli]MCP2684764.1 hypothetical protein [Siccirubricoccus soli]